MVVVSSVFHYYIDQEFFLYLRATEIEEKGTQYKIIVRVHVRFLIIIVNS